MMKAVYMSLLQDEHACELQVHTIEDVSRLVQAVRLESKTSAVDVEGGVPLFTLCGLETYLHVAPVDYEIILFFQTKDGDQAYTSLDPGKPVNDDDTYWFFFDGSASELPHRYAIAEDLALAAIAQFMADSSVLPGIPGFTWEKDWDF
ncbi:MAG: Imm1 family immunity protein [Propionibacteriaceae bacterium]|nr:Imm1 family immunity protein [Propionibacteriaceae bacterium]